VTEAEGKEHTKHDLSWKQSDGRENGHDDKSNWE